MKKEKEESDKRIIDSSSESQKLKILKQKCAYLFQIGKPFKLVKSGTTYELVSSLWNEKAFRRGFSAEDLRFINSVRHHVDKEDIALKFVDTDFKGSEIKYIRVNDFKAGDRVDDLIYIDVNAAYWHTAHILGVISDPIFKKGNGVNKIVRLAALGSLAKTKSVWEFDGKSFGKKETIRKGETENIWFAICKRVSDVMYKISKEIGKDFVFYWVDGIYIKNKDSAFQKVLKILIENGYSSKFEKVPFVEFREDGFTVQGAIKSDKKEFNWGLSDKDQSKPITKYLENKRLLKLAKSIMYNKGEIN